MLKEVSTVASPSAQAVKALVSRTRVIIALYGSQLALVRGFSAVRVDSIVDDSWIVACGSKCCKKIRVTNLSVAALADAMGKALKRHGILVIDEDAELRACTQKLGKIPQDFLPGHIPFRFCSQQGLLACGPRLFVSQAGNVKKEFWVRTCPVVRPGLIIVDMVVEGTW